MGHPDGLRSDLRRIDGAGGPVPSWIESCSRAMEIFHCADLDNDGCPDRQEHVAAGNPPWSGVAAGGRGEVATLEFVGARKHWLRPAGRDADGTLSPVESGGAADE